MRLQFSLLTFLLAITVLATVLWNYAPRTNQVIIEKTGRMLDLAIAGDGYFELSADDGSVVYSRDGRFAINGDGQIIHDRTSYVAASGIMVPNISTRIHVTPGGQVQAAERGEFSHVAIGQLNLSLFHNSERLLPLGNGCFSNTDASGQAISCIPGEYGAGNIAQGWLERETQRWSIEGNLPILMLLVCVGAASLQVWTALSTRSKNQTPTAVASGEMNSEIA